MVDLVGRIIFYRLESTLHALDDCLVGLFSWDDWLEQLEMDPLGFLLLCWILFAGLVYFAAEPVRTILTKFLGGNERLPAVNRAPAVAPLAANKSPEKIVPLRLTGSSTESFIGVPDQHNDPAREQSNVPAETLQARVKLINFSQEGSDWVNNVLNWLYHRYNTTPEFADIWLSALNDYAKRNSQQLGILVTFERCLPTSRPPKIGDVRAELAPDEQLSIFCSVELVQLGFVVLATVTTERNTVNTETYHVDVEHSAPHEPRFVHINDLRQVQRPPSPSPPRDTFQLVMNIFPNPQNEISLSAEFENKQPREMVVNVRPTIQTAVVSEEEQLQREILAEAVKECLLNTVTTLKLARFRDFPFPHWHRPSSRPSSPLAKEPLQTHFPFNAPGAGRSISVTGDHQLLVKVARATGIGGGLQGGGSEPYCVIEMDEPPQKHTTSVIKQQGNNPVWDESFKFDISPETHEVLFELYDRAKPHNRNFLGTAIVGLHELRRNPHQRQIIPLQPRPLTNDSVTGTLTLEFSILAGGVPLSEKMLDINVPFNPVGQSRLASNPNRQSPVHGLDSGRSSPGRFTSGEFFHSTTTRTPAISRTHSEDVESKGGSLLRTPKQPRKVQTHLTVPKSATDGHLVDDDRVSNGKERSKSSDRKPTFFGRMKRRFSLGKKRSKSLDPQTAREEFYMVTSTSTIGINEPVQLDQQPEQPPSVNGSIATNSLSRKDLKARKKAAHARSKSAPGSRDPSTCRPSLSHAGSATKAQSANWRDKLRSRFSRRKEHEMKQQGVVAETYTNALANHGSSHSNGGNVIATQTLGDEF